ncbi:MAG: hypothetical protein RAK20_06735 [Conexivisphaerales archaeon]|nr:hypothetical protein [Conexivisphaerales archaeon]
MHYKGQWMLKAKSQSTIIGSLIVIVITVILGIAILSWGVSLFTSTQSGFNSIFFTKAQMVEDNFNIEYINESPSSSSIVNGLTIWVGNYGQTGVQIISVIVYNSTYSYTYKCNVMVPPSGLAKINIDGLQLVKNGVYSVKVVASDGNTAVSET